MKTASVILSLTGLLVSLTTASPAAPADSQLEARQGIICIGCINTPKKCREASSPSGCVKNADSLTDWDASECDEYCFSAQAGCNCCKVKDGEVDNDDCDFNGP
ncbi:hypothetical protein CC79DRAFT_454824 [Sarocladium strictum]